MEIFNHTGASISPRFNAVTNAGLAFVISMAHRITTAACLIIGDEVLNAKIKDLNSYSFAKYCFELGIDLRSVMVVPDESEEIVAAIRSMQRYDFIVTSGGIGPTHDDITYEALAKAYNLPLKLDKDTEARMNLLAKNKPKDRPALERQAALRMATFPAGPNVTKYFVADDLWVPVVSIDHRVHVLPGIPRLFNRLLNGLMPFLLDRLDTRKCVRHYVSTQTSESGMATPLGEIQEKYAVHGVKIGSYPHMESGCNTVSIICNHDDDVSHAVVAEVIQQVGGYEISAEEEAKLH